MSIITKAEIIRLILEVFVNFLQSCKGSVIYLSCDRFLRNIRLDLLKNRNKTIKEDSIKKSISAIVTNLLLEASEVGIIQFLDKKSRNKKYILNVNTAHKFINYLIFKLLEQDYSIFKKINIT